MNLRYGYFWNPGVMKQKTTPLPTPTSDLWANAIVGFPSENLLKSDCIRGIRRETLNIKKYEPLRTAIQFF